MIYFIQAGEGGNIKIGFTDHDDAATCRTSILPRNTVGSSSSKTVVS